MQINNIDEIMGMQCTYNAGDDVDVWNESRMVKCKVIGYSFDIEESGCFNFLDMQLHLEPIENSSMTGVPLSSLDIDDIKDGVALESVIFDV